MPPYDKTILCASENGEVSVFNNAVAYELKFRQFVCLLSSEQVEDTKTTLSSLQDADWFYTEDQKFIFFSFPQANASFLFFEGDVRELLNLLSEAAAMIKVHHKLLFKHPSKSN